VSLLYPADCPDDCQREQWVIVEPLPQDLISDLDLTLYFYVRKLAECLWIISKRCGELFFGSVRPEPFRNRSKLTFGFAHFHFLI
jgi:hypothetical protein